MRELWSDLLACLSFDAEAATTRFTARNQHLDYHRIFGGQLLGQFIAIATLTSPGKTVKSLHAVFPREGHADDVLTDDGVLVASYGQESLLRIPN